MPREVRIGFDTPCKGLDDPATGRHYPVGDDRTALLPASVADRLLGSGMPAASVTRAGIGWSPSYEGAWERIFGRKEG